MTIVLPELKKGDVIKNQKTGHTMRVFQVNQGALFEEPVYKLQGMYGVKLKETYTREELAGMGYMLQQRYAP